MKVSIKRAYEEANTSDGYRVLVDRLWPRGIKKENLKIDDWCKDVAPSNELRQWFGHDPSKYIEFKKRYIAELKESDAVRQLIGKIPKGRNVTLIYSAKDETHNQAVVLKEYIENKAN